MGPLRRASAMALLLACTAATGACRHAVMVADAGPKPPVSEGTISGLLQTPGNGAAVVGRKVTVINNANGQRYEVSTNNTGGFTVKVPAGYLPDRSRAAAGRSRDRRANRSACGRERHRCPHHHHRGTGLTNAVDSSGSACLVWVPGAGCVPEFRVTGAAFRVLRYEPGTRNRRTWNAERTRNPTSAPGTRNPEPGTSADPLCIDAPTRPMFTPPARRPAAASSRCLRARRCGSARRNGQGYRSAP